VGSAGGAAGRGHVTAGGGQDPGPVTVGPGPGLVTGGVLAAGTESPGAKVTPGEGAGRGAAVKSQHKL